MPLPDGVRVLHVDDDAAFRRLAAKSLEDVAPELELETVASGRKALERLEEGGFDAVVCDYKLPDHTGVELLETVRERDRELPFILFTGRGDEAVASEAISAGVTDYLSKDGDRDRFEVLANRIRKAVQARRNRRRLAERERELERKERRYQAILEDPNILAGRVDPDGILVDVNGTAMEYVAGDPEDVVGEPFWGTPWWPEDVQARREVKALLERALEGEYVDFEADLERPDGEPYAVRGFFRPVRDDDGEVVSVIVSSRDVTERRKREERLRAQNEHLDEFAHLVSHDLRNPLNVAAGQVQLARREQDSDHLREAEAAHKRMETLIDDLLDLAQRGASIEDTEPLALDEVVERCWANVDTGDSTLETAGSRVLHADPGRLAQLLENLFRNAVEHGGRAPRVRVGSLEDGFYVEDDGPGIPDDDRDRVFASGFTGSQGGTGLGLSIVHRIARAHGWTVTATTGEAGGARFEVAGVERAEHT